MDSLCRVRKIIMYVLEWRTVNAPTRGLFWCLFPELQSNERNKHKNNTRVSAQTVRHKSTYIITFLTRHNESINEAKTGIFTHHPRVSLARITFCWYDDVTIDWRWRHNDRTIVTRTRPVVYENSLSRHGCGTEIISIADFSDPLTYENYIAWNRLVLKSYNIYEFNMNEIRGALCSWKILWSPPIYLSQVFSWYHHIGPQLLTRRVFIIYNKCSQLMIIIFAIQYKKHPWLFPQHQSLWECRA